jgi:hypothetical protein
MFWIVLLLVVGALSMLKLGALSVWVKVLSVGLAIAVAVSVLGLGVVAWRRLSRRVR